MYVYAYNMSLSYTRTLACIGSQLYTQASTGVIRCIPPFTQQSIHFCIHTCMHPYIHTSIHTYAPKDMNTLTHRRVLTDTRMHTNMCAYMQACTHAQGRAAHLRVQRTRRVRAPWCARMPTLTAGTVLLLQGHAI